MIVYRHLQKEQWRSEAFQVCFSHGTVLPYQLYQGLRIPGSYCIYNSQYCLRLFGRCHSYCLPSLGVSRQSHRNQKDAKFLFGRYRGLRTTISSSSCSSLLPFVEFLLVELVLGCRFMFRVVSDKISKLCKTNNTYYGLRRTGRKINVQVVSIR
jgi:hypothetical protein